MFWEFVSVFVIKAECSSTEFHNETKVVMSNWSNFHSRQSWRHVSSFVILVRRCWIILFKNVPEVNLLSTFAFSIELIRLQHFFLRLSSSLKAENIGISPSGEPLKVFHEFSDDAPIAIHDRKNTFCSSLLSPNKISCNFAFKVQSSQSESGVFPPSNCEITKCNCKYFNSNSWRWFFSPKLLNIPRASI